MLPLEHQSPHRDTGAVDGGASTNPHHPVTLVCRRATGSASIRAAPLLRSRLLRNGFLRLVRVLQLVATRGMQGTSLATRGDAGHARQGACGPWAYPRTYQAAMDSVFGSLWASSLQCCRRTDLVQVLRIKTSHTNAIPHRHARLIYPSRLTLKEYPRGTQY